MIAPRALPEPVLDDEQIVPRYLSDRDLERLENYKWIYSLEANGFEHTQAKRLLFVRWRFNQRQEVP